MVRVNEDSRETYYMRFCVTDYAGGLQLAWRPTGPDQRRRLGEGKI